MSNSHEVRIPMLHSFSAISSYWEWQNKMFQTTQRGAEIVGLLNSKGICVSIESLKVISFLNTDLFLLIMQ